MFVKKNINELQLHVKFMIQILKLYKGDIVKLFNRFCIQPMSISTEKLKVVVTR